MSLHSYYQINFSLAQHHKYSISEVESLMPFERDLYVDMLGKYLEKLRKEAEQRR